MIHIHMKLVPGCTLMITDNKAEVQIMCQYVRAVYRIRMDILVGFDRFVEQ